MEPSPQQVCDDLQALIRSTKRAWAIMAEPYELTLPQLYTLYAINPQGTTMGQVADAMHCDASNITGIIDRLVAQGMVTRSENPADRRAKLLELTAKGRRVLDAITAALPAQLGCDKLSATERATLHDLIRKVLVL
jgi:DNA-binding MarR family transcriptional regulator